MAKPNYQYEKRQKEIAKKAKQEEKRRQKLKDTSKDDAKDDASQAPASVADVPPAEGSQR